MLSLFHVYRLFLPWMLHSYFVIILSLSLGCLVVLFQIGIASLFPAFGKHLCLYLIVKLPCLAHITLRPMVKPNGSTELLNRFYVLILSWIRVSGIGFYSLLLLPSTIQYMLAQSILLIIPYMAAMLLSLLTMH